MAKTDESTKKINEALELLNEAAREKKEEIEGMLEGKYSDLKCVLTDIEADAEAEARRRMARAKEMGHDAADSVRRTAGAVDRRVHDDPWKMLGWGVAAAFAVGFLFGRKE